MSDAEDIEQIKAQKKEELLTDESTDDTTVSPDEPVHVGGVGEFESAVEEYDTVLVDFYADWCGPCKMLEPVVEELAAETDAAVLKVDVDAHQELASQHQVRGVPTVVLFAGGEVAEQVVGVRDKSHYASLIERHGA
ncbi:thioredoxin [Halorhabdus sp. CUG00001]|uniref:thioredoxin n=1 Tax=Halorhabdus sp. CUG00001 TaxID=2600297 RepID=UPI00131E8200|nr:thioredoxin [Halorhabdus sp. CUG00001]